ncbi:hypothetical protein [Paraburkholderia tropica]|uniref:hypothetical protein n=1 Tax=Paraburkholderia tropica TaxID=92647 RepID=UPI003D2E1388
MARPAHANPSAATLRRRNNRAKWRDARRFTGFSFEAVMYDRIKASWMQHRERNAATAAGRSTFTDWVAASMNAFDERPDDERTAFVVAYMESEAARRADVANANVSAPVEPVDDTPAPYDFNALADMTADEAAS